MSTIEEQIKDIEKEIQKTPHHKGTDHHIGRLRAKLSKLKDREIEKVTMKIGGGGGYAVKKQGDATVVLVGPPSAGKSTLINILTNAKSKVAPYAFTTLTVIPGMMDYMDAKIQILDVPGLIEGAEKGKGRGREVLSVIRGADLLIIISDTKRVSELKSIATSLEENGIRINKEKPRIKIEKKISGGLQVITNIKQDFDKETVKEISKEFRLPNAEVTLKEKVTIDELIDVYAKNRVYVPAINVLNKSDLLKESGIKDSSVLYISAEDETNIDKLISDIWKKLNLTRVYLIRKDEKPHKNSPIIMKKGDTLFDVAKKIGEEFVKKKENAKIWGRGAKYPGQKVSLTKKIEEEMQIRFI